MSYQMYNIADEIKVSNLCHEIMHIEQEIEKLRLRIGKLQDQKYENEAAIDRIREAARARAETTSLETGTTPLPLPPSGMP